MVKTININSELTGTLNVYQPITLEEMDSVKLMNRTDTKYFFHTDILKEILEKASNYYRALEINNQRQFLYFTTYFDTPDYLFYYDHHNGKLNRYKIRQRRYVINGSEFFEIKHKTNKGWTLKSRITNSDPDFLNEKTDSFLKNKTPYSNKYLQKVITNDFIRITLVNKQLTERATLDYGLVFSNYYKKSEFPYVGILEVKQDKKSNHSVLFQIMRELKIRPEGVSKYCLGVASLCHGVKVNRIKQQILKIKSL